LEARYKARMKKSLLVCASALLTLSFSLLSTTALASSKGISSSSFGSSGCNQCHGGGTAPKVDLLGPSKLDGGAAGIFTLTIADQGGKQNFGGLNVRADAGVLATGGPEEANTKAINGAKNLKEITHTSKKAAVDGVVSFSFSWTAPTDTPGCAPVALRAWGNAVNNSGTSGDAAEEVTIEVEVCNEGVAGAGGSGQAGAGGSAGSGGAAAGSGGSEGGQGGSSAGASGSDAGSGGGPAGSGGSAQAGSGAGGGAAAPAPAEAEDEGGCSTRGPGREGSGAALLLALGLLASRRRR
jgi:MYXO-CTERM domain-containing protein